jgi:hypothetical protein
MKVGLLPCVPLGLDLNGLRSVCLRATRQGWFSLGPIPAQAVLCLPKRHRLFEEVMQIVAFRRTRCEMPNLLWQRPFDECRQIVG